MALHSKKDFAAICGITTREISTYLKRQKIIASGDYIDDALQQNQEFIAHRQLVKEKAGDFDEEIETEQPMPHVRAPQQKGMKPRIEDPELDLDESGTNLYALTKKKLVAEIGKKEKETRILESRIQKLRGELMPTDLVKLVFKQFSKSLLSEFKNSVDDIITKLSKKRDLSLVEVAEIRGQLIDSINTGSARGVDVANQSIENIISEYSENKEVGERS